jgi:3-oxoacyl-[acyl-carrier-protein] synthase-3
MAKVPDVFLKPVDIIGWGMSVPKTVRDNKYFLPFTPYKSVAEVFRRCGVRERRVLGSEEWTADLATEAAERALDRAGMSAQTVDHIICANTLPDDLAYPISSIVQKNLGATQAAVMDVRAACTGFIKGLEVATCLIDSGNYSNILVIGVETPSRLYEEAPHVAMLFGDCAGGVVLTRSERRKHWVFSMGDDGNLWDLRRRPFSGDKTVVFQGPRVFKEAVETMVRTTSEVMEKARVSLKDIKLFVPHQANTRIIKSVAQRLNLTDRLGRLKRRVFVNIEKYGNTSAASIPIALTEAAEKGRLKKGALIALAAFGAGMTSGAAIIEW